MDMSDIRTSSRGFLFIWSVQVGGAGAGLTRYHRESEIVELIRRVYCSASVTVWWEKLGSHRLAQGFLIYCVVEVGLLVDKKQIA